MVRSIHLSAVLRVACSLLITCCSLASASHIFAAAPSNDLISNALSVTGERFDLAADLTGASEEIDEPSFGGARFGFTDRRSLWWTWTVPRSGVWAWDSSASPKAVSLSIFSKKGDGSWLERGKSFIRPPNVEPSSVATLDSKGTVQVREGEMIWLRLAGTWEGEWAYAEQGMRFGFPITPYPVSVAFQPSTEVPPANDNFVDRMEVGLLPAQIPFDLRGATSEASEPQTEPQCLGETAWWTLRSPGTGSLMVSLNTSNVSPLTTIFVVGPNNSLTPIANSATTRGTKCYNFSGARDILEWNCFPEELYAIQLDRFSISAQLGSFNVHFTAAPANDDPENATVLLGNDLYLVASNLGASHRLDEPELPGVEGSKSVWFSWQADAAGVVQSGASEPLSYQEPFYIHIDCGNEILTGNLCSFSLEDLNPLPKFKAFFGAFRSWLSPISTLPPTDPVAVDPDRLVFETAANEQWLIAMDGHTNTSGTSLMYLRWTPPPTNDTWAGRIVLPSTAVTVGGRTFAATADVADHEVLGLPPGTLRTVWWEWRAPSAGRWGVPNLGSSDDVSFAIFRGDQIKATNRITPGPEPVFCFDAAEGETFEVVAFSTTGFGGNVAFALRPVQSPAVRLARKRGEGGVFRTLLETAENTGLPYEIQISSDLVYWRHFTSVQNPYGGLFESNDFRYLGQAFFRTQLVTPNP